MSARVEAVGFIGDSRPVDEFISERIFPASYYFGQSEMGNYHNIQLTEDIFKEYLQNITDSDKKVVTYWSSWNSGMYNKFLDLKVNTYHLSNQDYPVIVLNSGFDQGTFEAASNNDDNYHLRGYDALLNSSNEYSVDYQNNYKSFLNSGNQYEEVYMYIIILFYYYSVLKHIVLE